MFWVEVIKHFPEGHMCDAWDGGCKVRRGVLGACFEPEKLKQHISISGSKHSKDHASRGGLIMGKILRPLRRFLRRRWGVNINAPLPEVGIRGSRSILHMCEVADGSGFFFTNLGTFSILWGGQEAIFLPVGEYMNVEVVSVRKDGLVVGHVTDKYGLSHAVLWVPDRNGVYCLCILNGVVRASDDRSLRRSTHLLKAVGFRGDSVIVRGVPVYNLGHAGQVIELDLELKI